MRTRRGAGWVQLTVTALGSALIAAGCADLGGVPAGATTATDDAAEKVGDLGVTVARFATR